MRLSLCVLRYALCEYTLCAMRQTNRLKLWPVFRAYRLVCLNKTLKTDISRLDPKTVTLYLHSRGRSPRTACRIPYVEMVEQGRRTTCGKHTAFPCGNDTDSKVLSVNAKVRHMPDVKEVIKQWLQ